MSRRLSRIGACLLLVPGSLDHCRAAEFLATLGSYKRYLDEPAAVAFGVALKIPVHRRFSIRPEFLFDNGRNYSSVLALASVTGDFTQPEKPVVGYWVAGAGGVRTRERALAFVPLQWAVLGGLGMRFAIRERWTAVAEFRAGWPAFPLVTFNIGYRWGRGIR
jgi:hypothetical protein